LAHPLPCDSIDLSEQFDSYYSKIYIFFRYRGADVDMADDLGSTVFERAVAKLSSFDPLKASLAGRFIRRNIDGVIVENQGKTRRAGDLRVTLFPSKYSRVRIPSPALEADYIAARSPTRRPTLKVRPCFGGSEETPWPFRFPPSDPPNRSMPRPVPVFHQDSNRATCAQL